MIEAGEAQEATVTVEHILEAIPEAEESTEDIKLEDIESLISVGGSTTKKKPAKIFKHEDSFLQQLHTARTDQL